MPDPFLSASQAGSILRRQRAERAEREEAEAGMQQLVGQLRAQDQAQMAARMSGIEEGAPPYTEFLEHGPVPLEYVPDRPLEGVQGTPEWQAAFPGVRAARDIMWDKRRSWEGPPRSPTDAGAFQDYAAAQREAWRYGFPEGAARNERAMLVDELQAQELARTQGLDRTFGTPEERAADIMATEASRAQVPQPQAAMPPERTGPAELQMIRTPGGGAPLYALEGSDLGGRAERARPFLEYEQAVRTLEMIEEARRRKREELRTPQTILM